MSVSWRRVEGRRLWSVQFTEYLSSSVFTTTTFIYWVSSPNKHFLFVSQSSATLVPGLEPFWRASLWRTCGRGTSWWSLFLRFPFSSSRSLLRIVHSFWLSVRAPHGGSSGAWCVEALGNMDFEGSGNVMSSKWAFVSPPEYLKKKQWSHLATTVHG